MGSRSSSFEEPLFSEPAGIRFVCISDTHNLHDEIAYLPRGDVLVHTGDFSEYGTCEEVVAFADWFASRPFKHKILIAGNHDIGMDATGYDTKIGATWKQYWNGTPRDNNPVDVRRLLDSRSDITYLENNSCVVEGIKIYGSPMTPLIVLPIAKPVAMAFNLMTQEEQHAHWQTIPLDTQVLLTHGPPAGVHDVVAPLWRLGDQDLYDRVLEVRPQYHIFGHVHQSYGRTEFFHDPGDSDEEKSSSTTFVNTSTCTLRHKPTNAPFVFDILPS